MITFTKHLNESEFLMEELHHEQEYQQLLENFINELIESGQITEARLADILRGVVNTATFIQRPIKAAKRAAIGTAVGGMLGLGGGAGYGVMKELPPPPKQESSWTDSFNPFKSKAAVETATTIGNALERGKNAALYGTGLGLFGAAAGGASGLLGARRTAKAGIATAKTIKRGIEIGGPPTIKAAKKGYAKLAPVARVGVEKAIEGLKKGTAGAKRAGIRHIARATSPRDPSKAPGKRRRGPPPS